ncbi:hypothetical protein [Streptomyces goshikiensis]|uniref:hypothetical protein n=1 Tax=Streptomyces goshikiensis TaxID=1942 RepID=UPI0036597935
MAGWPVAQVARTTVHVLLVPAKRPLSARTIVGEPASLNRTAHADPVGACDALEALSPDSSS